MGFDCRARTVLAELPRRSRVRECAPEQSKRSLHLAALKWDFVSASLERACSSSAAGPCEAKHEHDLHSFAPPGSSSVHLTLGALQPACASTVVLFTAFQHHDVLDRGCVN